MAAGKSEHLSQLAMVVTEAFDASLATAADALEMQDLEELVGVWKATDDKSEKMRKIRQRFLKGENELTDNERLDLMSLTTGLERASWVLHGLLEDLIDADNPKSTSWAVLETSTAESSAR